MIKSPKDKMNRVLWQKEELQRIDIFVIFKTETGYLPMVNQMKKWYVGNSDTPLNQVIQDKNYISDFDKEVKMIIGKAENDK